MENPLDDIARKLISRNPWSWVLGLAKAVKGDQSEVSSGGQPIQFQAMAPELDKDRLEYVAPADYRGHRLMNTESLIAFTQKYGNSQDSLIFINDDQIELVLKETVSRGPREIVICAFEYSVQWEQWKEMLDRDIDQVAFVRFCMSHKNDFVKWEGLEDLKYLRGSVSVDIESEITDEGDHFGAKLKSKVSGKSGQAIKLIQEFKIDIPIMAQDVIDKKSAEIEFQLEVILPSQQDKTTYFRITSVNWDERLKQRIQQEAEKIREGLAGHLVVAGQSNYQAFEGMIEKDVHMTNGHVNS